MLPTTTSWLQGGYGYAPQSFPGNFMLNAHVGGNTQLNGPCAPSQPLVNCADPGSMRVPLAWPHVCSVDHSRTRQRTAL